MTPTLTIAVMLLLTLGAALYVAWPLLFGKVDPEEYLAMEGPAPGPKRAYPGREMPRSGSYADSSRKRAVASSRVELDIEQEIEAYRRKERQSGSQPALACPSCGKPVKDPDAAFCAKCGSPIRKSSAQNKKTGKN